MNPFLFLRGEFRRSWGGALALVCIFLPGKISLWVAVLIVQFLMYAKVFPALWILKKGKWVKNITV